MAITTIGGSINSTAVLPNLDYKYGPYNSLQEAYNTLGPNGVDKLVVGLTVGILENGRIREYWFRNKTDSITDLVLKSEGPSAYDIAVEEGYEGTEEQWISSLRGEKGSDAVNPFKGWFNAVVTGEAGSRVITSESEMQNLPESPSVGDYAYVKTWEISGTAPDQTEIPITKIYECTTEDSWTDSGRIADTTNTQTFASGEEVNEMHIDDTHLVNPLQNSIPLAQDVKTMCDNIFTNAAKTALINLLRKVAYVDGQEQSYLNELYIYLFPDVVSISAVFSQDQSIFYEGDDLAVLKQNLVVTALYQDGTSITLPSNAYTLSGELIEGDCTITVTYGNKSDTFEVIVSSGE